MTRQDLENHIKQSGLKRRDWYHLVYLKSDHWRDLRQQKFDEVGRFCEVCKTKKRIQVHHLRYRNIYDVLTSDLQVLCERHHKDQHPEHRRKKAGKKGKKAKLATLPEAGPTISVSQIPEILATFDFTTEFHIKNAGRRPVPKPMSKNPERNLFHFFKMVRKARGKRNAAIASGSEKAIRKRSRTLAIAEQRFRTYASSLGY